MRIWDNIMAEKNLKPTPRFATPGLGNTGVSREICHLFQSSIVIDYLTFTFPFGFKDIFENFSRFSETEDRDHFKGLCRFLRLDEKEAEIRHFGHGAYTYGLDWAVPVQYVGESKPVTTFDYWNKRDNAKSARLEMTGNCCRDFERRLHESGVENMDEAWEHLLAYIGDGLGGGVSRIDIAFDFFNVPMDDPFMYFYNKIMNCEFNSPISKINPDYSFDDWGDARTFDVQILKLGGKGSSVQAEMYNKKLQQESRKLNVFVDNWIRFELKFRDERAKSLVYHLLQNWDRKDEYLVSILKLYFNFKERPKCNKDTFVPNSTRRHWKTDPVWEEMVGTLHNQKIENVFKHESTITGQAVYLSGMQAQNIARVYHAYGSNGWQKIFQKILAEGTSKIDASGLALINYHRSIVNSQDELTEDDLKNFVDDLDAVLDDEEDDSYLVDENGCVMKTYGDLLASIDPGKDRPSTPDRLRTYEKRKTLYYLIRKLKDEFYSGIDKYSSDQLKDIINSMIDQITGNGKEVRNDGQEEKGE